MFFKSLKSRVILTFLVVMIAMFIFMLISSNYSIKLAENQLTQSSMNLMQLHGKAIDKNLENISQFLYDTVANDTNVIAISTNDENSYEYIRGLHNLKDLINRSIGYYMSIDNMFFYDSKYKMFFGAYRNDAVKLKLNEINEKIQGLINEKSDEIYNYWEIIKLNDGYNLVRVFGNGIGMYLGVVINVDEIINPFKELSFIGDNTLITMTRNDAIVSNSISIINRLKQLNVNPKDLNRVPSVSNRYINGEKYFLLSNKLQEANLNFIAVIPQNNMIKGLYILKRTTYLMPVIILFVILIVYMMIIQKMIMKPMSKVIVGMNDFKSGILDVSVDKVNTKEFDFLIDTFNEMVKEIHQLKIAVYEDEIKVKKAELKYLQVQINPHFYSNTLNIICNYAALKDYNSVQSLARLLGNYFRFIMNSNVERVQLKDEIKHISDYLEIQRNRFPSTFKYCINLPEELHCFLIPPLTIQPFVENSFIHGFKKELEVFSIEIIVEVIKHSEKEFLMITLKDNGIGFNEETLRMLQKGEYYGKENTEHLGIWNVARRLYITYNNDARITFENCHGSGAMVKVLLPYNY